MKITKYYLNNYWFYLALEWNLSRIKNMNVNLPKMLF